MTRWPAWAHTPASFLRYGWREGSTWIALIGFGVCAWLFDPPTMAAIGERLDAVAALAAKLGVAVAAVLLIARRSPGEGNDEPRNDERR